MSQQQSLSRFFKPKPSNHRIKPLKDISSVSPPYSKSRSSADSPTAVSKQYTTPPDEFPELQHVPLVFAVPTTTPAIVDFKYNKSTGEECYSSPKDQSKHNQFVQKLKGHTSRKRKVTENQTTDDDLIDNNDDEDGTKESKKRTKASKPAKLTPLEQQFVDLKKPNPDKILAIQVGYKYKFFGQDARVAAGILNIMLIPGKMSIDPTDPRTREEDAQYDRFAYCSIPDVRLHIHLKRLLTYGLKVAVVDQNETSAIKSNSSNKSKVFERKISKVYTTSTYIDEDTVKNGNYIICLKDNGNVKNHISLVAVNIYSADIVYDSFEDDFTRAELETRFLHLDPIEFVLIGDVSKETSKCIETFKTSVRSDADTLRINYVDDGKTTREIIDILNDNLNEEMFSFLIDLPANVKNCFVELMVYLKQFEMSNVFQLKENYLHFTQLDKNMILDSNTLKNLEIFQNATNGQEYGSFAWLMDHTNTNYGSRMLRKWIGRPLTNREEIMKRVDSVECIINNFKSIPIEITLKFLKSSPDLELSLNRIHYGRCKRKDAYLFLKKFDGIFEIFGGLKDTLINFESHYLSEIFQEIKKLSNYELKDFRRLITMIYSPAALDESTDDDDHILKYFNSSFHDYHLIGAHFDNIASVEEQLQNELVSIRQITKRPNMNYITNNKEPYLVEVRNTSVGALPKDWIKINGTKSVARFRTPQTSELYKSMQYHKELLINECNQCFNKFIEIIDNFYPFLNKLIKLLSTLDCLISLSAASSLHENYTKPEFTDKPHINLIESRNPIAENLQLKTTLGTGYISNDVQMSQTDGRIVIITGPNMGGKSSFIRQVALNVIMAQIGCFIPATKGSTLGIFDSIFTRMGAQDDIHKGESTFQVELGECSSIIRNCTERSLVLLDEVGRGTSTVDGYAIAHSILKYLVEDVEPFVLFITHFQNLKVFDRFDAVKNYHLGFEKHDDELMFTYHLENGCCDRSYGVNCAKLAGLPVEVTDQAFVVSKELEESWSLQKALHLWSTFQELKENQEFEKLWDVIDELD